LEKRRFISFLLKGVLIGIILFNHFPVPAQSYFLYGTHTLAESSINPSVQTFDNKKECKKLAFNFFVPNIQMDFSSFGPVSHFIYVYNVENKVDSGFYTANPNKNNYFTTNQYLHLLTVKVLLNRKKSEELLLDYSIRGIGYLNLQNTILTLIPELNNAFSSGSITGINSSYPQLLNTNTFYYSFSQITLGFRRNISEEWSWGLNGGYLTGIFGSRIKINPSNLIINSQEFNLTGNGGFQINHPFTSDSNFNGLSSVRTYLPSTQNPGFVISGGMSYKPDKFSEFSLNLKDLGFIHWQNAKQYLSVDTVTYNPGNPFFLNKQINKGFKSYYKDGGYTSYYGTLPAYIEGFYSKVLSKYYRGTLVLSKNLITPEGNFVWVHDVRLQNFHFLVNTGYNSLQNFRLGVHLLYKTPLIEAFLGSENIGPSLNLPNEFNGTGTSGPGSSVGLNFNFGFAIRLGTCFKIQTATDMRTQGPYNFWQRLFQRKALPYERDSSSL